MIAADFTSRLRISDGFAAGCAALLLSLLFVQPLYAQTRTQIDIPAPAGSEHFGEAVVTLANGNFVVVDTRYDASPSATDVGAVSLYNGDTLALISRLTGSTKDDYVGGNGIVALPSGNFLVRSPQWHNGGAPLAGAVTWVNGTLGLTGTVSVANSLVGSTAEDRVGESDITVLTNGNYVVSAPYWDNGATTDAGAATWGNGESGISGTINAGNSLVGSRANDNVSSEGVAALTNGNYVVASPFWNSDTVTDVGAATWGNGMSGVSGVVDAGNSLVGSTARDYLGAGGIVALSDGDYVVSSPKWDNGAQADAGAATWGNGASGVQGELSADNSLVGTWVGSKVGDGGVTALSNGHYVVISPYWRDTGSSSKGAVTWGDGDGGVKGAVSSANSLVGSGGDEMLGSGGVVALTTGNYVVVSPSWDSLPTYDLGAVTWGDGSKGITGTVSSTNSLVGSRQSDRVGSGGVTPLANGNYVVKSYTWANGTNQSTGAATWGNGNGGTVGAVGAGNSLIGTSANDEVSFGVTALTNGNYVVLSANWSNGTLSRVGAATWCDGSAVTAAAVSSANSLVGSTPLDRVGAYGATALTNGNYVVLSNYWSNNGANGAGAVTWGNGASGIKGVVSSDNSLVGSSASDNVGGDDVVPLSDGNYIVLADSWDSSSAVDVGAITWGDGSTGVSGPITSANSVVGGQEDDRVGMCGVAAVGNGGYWVLSQNWNNGSIENAGAASLAFGPPGPVGLVSVANSVLGTTTDNGDRMSSAWDDPWQQFVVGRPKDGFVSVVYQTWPLAVSKSGAGTGAVTSSPAAIDCGATCLADLQFNRVVTLNATPDGSSVFTGWSGDCSGTGACELTMDRAHSVTANFALKTFALTTQTGGMGAGAISGIPANPAALPYGTVVRIDAIPNASSTFAGWSGDCGGTDTCELTMNQAHSVTANFALKTFALTTQTSGTGAGAISGIPANPAALPYGTVVRIDAIPNASSTFAGWSGDCGGTDTCELTMNHAHSVTATFTLKQLTVTLPDEQAGGSVSVTPVAGQAAEADAPAATYPYGTLLQFTATPNAGYAFTNWGGLPNATQNPQQVTLTAPLNVTAQFAQLPPQSVDKPVYLPVIVGPTK